MKSITDGECLNRIKKGNEVVGTKLKNKYSNKEYKQLFKKHLWKKLHS